MVLSVAKDWALATRAGSTEYGTVQQGGKGAAMGDQPELQQWETAREAAMGVS